MSKRDRQQNAIGRIEKTIALHTSGTALTEKILADKNKDDPDHLDKKTTDQIEKIRKKKLERAQQTLDNTKARMR